MGEPTQKKILLKPGEEFLRESVVPVIKEIRESWWGLDPSDLGIRSLRWGKGGGGGGLDAMTSGCPFWKCFGEVVHELSLSHCLSANNSCCSGSGTGQAQPD